MPGNHLLIAAGKPMISSVMTILGMCANVVLDPLMIFGGEGCRQMVSRLGWGWLSRLSNPLWDLLGFVPGMGIRGAALATIISQAMSALLLLGLLHRLKLFSFRPIPRGELLRIWRKITGYAIPAILGMMLFPITNYITTRVTASFGDAMVAATAAAGRLEMVTFVVPMAFGIPLMSVVAQNYGAKLYSRVKYVFKFASAIAFGILAVAAVVLFFFTHRIAPLFTPAIQVQELIVTYMKIIPWGFGLLELSRYAGFALTGTGHPRLDATLKALRMVALLIPLSLLAWWLKWQNGVFYARLAADVIGGVICWGWAAWIVHRLPADGEEVPHQKTIPPPQKA